jgi:hypothetical protein
VRLLNLITEPVTAAGWPGAWTGGPVDGICDPALGGGISPTDTHTIADATGAGLWEEWISRGGRLWVAGAPGVAASTVPRLAVSGGALAASVRAMVTGTPGAGVDLPQASTAYGAWAAWPGGGANGHWVDIDYGGQGADARFVVGDGTSGAIRRAPDPASPFNLPLTAPGFAAGVTCLAHSHHDPADLYPDDPGNHIWVALTAAQCSISVHANANVWTAAAAHGLAAAPLDLACSKLTGEWIAVDAAAGICRSADGLVWTNAGPGTAGGLYSVIVAPTTARIATDGFGHWMVLLVDAVAGTAELHASHDDGATWREVWPDIILAAITDGALWHGHSQFHVVLMDPVVPAGVIYATHRVGE